MKNLFKNFDLFKGKANAFTLAETLITLGIIGVVAAITVPTLMKDYQERAWNTSASVFSRKLSEALRIMNTQGTLANHDSTTDFVNALSKTMKITKVCDADHMDECFAGKLVLSIIDFDNNGKLSDTIKSIKLANDIGLTWNTEVVGVVFADGVSAMLAYNPDCIEEPYNNTFDGSTCVSGFFDINGRKKPNRLDITADIRAYGNVAVKSNAAMKINGKYWTAPFAPTTFGNTNKCIEYATGQGYGSGWCSPRGEDYWFASMKECGGVENLPTQEDLLALARTLYKPFTGTYLNGSYNSEKAKIFLSLGKNGTQFDNFHGGFALWSNVPNGELDACYQNYANTFTGWSCMNYKRHIYGYAYTICKTDF